MSNRLVALLVVLGSCAGLAGCGTGAGSGGVGSASLESGSIDVPDVSGGDGAQAVSDVEAAGLESTLADANNDPGFDSSRDATDCEVTDQDPAAGELASEGDEVTISVDCSQVDWSNQEGAQWDAFNEAYVSSFDDGCQALFDQSPDGSLYEDDTEYTPIDCQNENPGDASQGSDVPQDVPDDPEQAGADLGQLDGCQSLFENDAVVSLNNGTDSITEDDCPVGGFRPPASARTNTSRAKDRLPGSAGSSGSPRRAHTKSTGESCTGTEADGAPIVLTVTKGKVKCVGAIALLNEWLRRAPHEGQGSGGAMELYGWGCIGGQVTEPSHVGSCERSGSDAAAFRVDVAPGE